MLSNRVATRAARWLSGFAGGRWPWQVVAALSLVACASGATQPRVGEEPPREDGLVVVAEPLIDGADVEGGAIGAEPETDDATTVGAEDPAAVGTVEPASRATSGGSAAETPAEGESGAERQSPRSDAVIVAGAPPGLVVELAVASRSSVVTLEVDGAVDYRTQRLRDPERFVVDLPGVVVDSSRRLEVGSAVLERVRWAQFVAEPQPVARVVLDLAGEAEVEIAGHAGVLVVTVTPR